MKNNDLKNIVVLLSGFGLLFITTLLLDIAWVQARTVRQVIVYGILVVIAVLFYGFFVTINKRSE